VLGREYGEGNGDEDTAHDDETVPAAGRADLFAEYKDSSEKIDKPGKSHPEICR
jgi:hypothetical protein